MIKYLVSYEGNRKLTVTNACIFFHIFRNIAFRLIAPFSEDSETTLILQWSQLQERNERYFPGTPYDATNACALHAGTNRPRGSFKVLVTVFVLTCDFLKYEIGKSELEKIETTF